MSEKLEDHFKPFLVKDLLFYIIIIINHKGTFKTWFSCHTIPPYTQWLSWLIHIVLKQKYFRHLLQLLYGRALLRH